MVPARAAFDMVGLDVDWNPATQSVTAHHGNYTVELKKDDTAAIVNGDKISLDVPARIISNRIYVPVRFVAETLGADVRWDEKSSTVTIYTHFLDEPVKFSDPYLREAVLAAANKKPGQELLKRDVVYITTLVLKERGIGSLHGISELTNLTQLDLSDNVIKNLDDLTSLKNLRQINLKSNRISSIAPLRSLTRLESVDLRDNDIEDISAVVSWVQLKELLIRGNRADNSEELSPLYYVRDRVKTDIDLSNIEEPDYDTWNLRSGADNFKLEVNPGVFWRPARTFGSTDIKNSEFKTLTENTPQGIGSHIESLYELLQYLQHVKFTIDNQDHVKVFSQGPVKWMYPEPASSVLTDMAGSEFSIASSLSYSLSQDYLESGIVILIYPDKSQRYLNFIRTKRDIVIEGEDEEDDKTITVPEYALFNPWTYQKDSRVQASIEDGKLETYASGDGMKANIHTAESLKALVEAYNKDQPAALALSIVFTGDEKSVYPLGYDASPRRDGSSFIHIPKSPEDLDDDKQPIETHYSVLYDDPSDSIFVKQSVLDPQE